MHVIKIQCMCERDLEIYVCCLFMSLKRLKCLAHNMHSNNMYGVGKLSEFILGKSPLTNIRTAVLHTTTWGPPCSVSCKVARPQISVLLLISVKVPCYPINSYHSNPSIHSLFQTKGLGSCPSDEATTREVSDSTGFCKPESPTCCPPLLVF